MVNKVIKNENFEWIDVTGLNNSDIETLTSEYQLHPATVEDCMSPSHLPKFEQINEANFIILRIKDRFASPDADELRSLTNKIAFFLTDHRIITIHRSDIQFLEAIKSKWKSSEVEDPSLQHLFNTIVRESIFTYKDDLIVCEEKVDKNERLVFSREKKSEKLIQELYVIKRKASFYKRMLKLTKQTLKRYSSASEQSSPFSTDLLDSVDSLYFQSDTVLDNVENLLNLHISLSSHRSNEVVALLTVFSVFFLPLTFITGLYGMNFENMPELSSEFGYPLVITVMVLITITSYLWFKKKGWL